MNNSITVYAGPGGLCINMVSGSDTNSSYSWDVRGYPKDYVEALRRTLDENEATHASKDWHSYPQPLFGFYPCDHVSDKWVEGPGDWIMASWICGDKTAWSMFLRKTEAYDLAQVIEDYWVM